MRLLLPCHISSRGIRCSLSVRHSWQAKQVGDTVDIVQYNIQSRESGKVGSTLVLQKVDEGVITGDNSSLVSAVGIQPDSCPGDIQSS